MNNYIVRSYRDIIVITNIITRRTGKALIIVMYSRNYKCFNVTP